MSDQGLPQLVQAESIKKSNSFEKETSQFNSKIVKDEKTNLKIVFRKISDDGEMDQIEVIDDDNSNPHSSKNEVNLMRVPSPQQIQYLNPLDGQELTIQKQSITKETMVSDGNDSDSSFGDIDSENEVKKQLLKFYFNIQ